MVLDANNTNSGGVEITDGTLVAGESSAIGSENNITITKGKFEVDSGVTLLVVLPLQREIPTKQ